MTAARQGNRFPVAIIGGATLLTGLLLLWTFGPGQNPDAPFSTALTQTARLAAAIFLLAFLASTLARLHPAARILVRNRRYLGLAFAVVHLTHGLLVYLWARDPAVIVDPVTLIGGGLAYGFVVLMAATSNDRSQRALGRWWSRLHWVGSYYVWFIFLFTFAGRGFSWSVSSVFAGLFLAALLLRITGRVSKH